MTYILVRPEPTKIRINEFVQERRDISADTAWQLARFFNISRQFWLILPSNYDVRCAEDAPGKVISRIRIFSEPTRQAAA